MSTRSNPRLLRSEEFDELAALLDRCFTYERGGMVDRFPFVYDQDRPDRHAVVEVDGNIVSHAACIPETLVISDGTMVECCGIGGVATAKPHRGNGYMSKLLEFWLDRIDDDGVPLVELGGDRQRYGHFGWERAGRELVYTVTQRSAPETGVVGKVVSFDRAADLESIRRLHRSHSLRVERDVSTARSIYGQRGLETLLYYDVSGEPRAYVCLTRESHDRGLREFGGTAAGIEALLSFLFDRTDAGTLTVLTHPSCPHAELFEKHSAGWQLRPPRSMNVRDLPAVVTAYAKPIERRLKRSPFACEGNLTLGIDGDDTAVLLTYDRENFDTEVVDADPELSWDRRDAARLLFGGSGRREQVADEYPILTALFPLDYYIWHTEHV